MLIVYIPKKKLIYGMKKIDDFPATGMENFGFIFFF